MTNYLVKPNSSIKYDLSIVAIIILFLWLCPMIFALFIVLSFLLLFVSFFLVWHLPWRINHQHFRWLASLTTLMFIAGMLVYTADTRFYASFDQHLNALSCPSQEATCIGGSGNHSIIHELYNGPTYNHASHLSKYFNYKKYF